MQGISQEIPNDATTTTLVDKEYQEKGATAPWLDMCIQLCVSEGRRFLCLEAIESMQVKSPSVWCTQPMKHLAPQVNAFRVTVFPDLLTLIIFSTILLKQSLLSSYRYKTSPSLSLNKSNAVIFSWFFYSVFSICCIFCYTEKCEKTIPLKEMSHSKLG